MKSSHSLEPDSRPRDKSDDLKDWGFGRPLLKNPWFYFALVLIALITFSRPLFRSVPDPLPVLKDIPQYSFLNQSGEVFGSEQLTGAPYVASFLFTRCPTVCPLISQKLAELQQQLRDGGLPVRVVSFTVDPEFDRPEILKAFGETYGADSERWFFLTPQDAQDEEFLPFLENAFSVGVEKGESIMDLAHSQKLLLIDQFGRLRGYFDASSEGIAEIFHRSVNLLGERDLTADVGGNSALH